MAYKNKAKQKKHVQALQGTGWRADNKVTKRYRRLMSALPNDYSTREKEAILKAQNLI